MIRHVLLIAGMWLATVLQAQADQRRAFRVGLDVAWFPQPELAGIGSYAEFSWHFTDRLAVVPRIMGASGIERSGTYFSHVAALGASVCFRFSPFPEGPLRPTLDVGPVYSRFTYNDRFARPVPVEVREHVPGFFISAALKIMDLRRMGLGVRVSSASGVRDGIIQQDILQGGVFMEVAF